MEQFDQDFTNLNKSYLLTASVILELNLPKALDYLIPLNLKDQIKIGSFVEVPLRSSMQKGTVVAIEIKKHSFSIKAIHRLLNENPLLPLDLLKLAEWMACYYATSLSATLKLMIPSCVKEQGKSKEQYAVLKNQTKEQLIKAILLLRARSEIQANILELVLKAFTPPLLTEVLEQLNCSKSSVDALVKKGLLILKKIAIDRSPLKDEEYFPSKPKILSSEQSFALEKMVKTLKANSFETHLLFGITGSGKTEVYLQAIQEALNLKKGVIMLVPEISLTTQTIERFRSRFEGKIAILHHRLSQGERYDEWMKIKKAEAQIVIGARSAIFSPIFNLGLIIVDEEHESSYKQTEDMPAYHARDVAVMRAKLSKATVILGSATPSLESFYNTQIGKYTLSHLRLRPTANKLPTVKIVDMRLEYEKAKKVTIFSDLLLNALEKNLKKGEQTILFLNKRGFHSFLVCLSCSERIKCPSCDLSLTFHKKLNLLSCHLCDFAKEPPKICPNCQADKPLKFKGIGTEQVESALHAIFPEIRTLRLDADTTRHKGSHQKLFRQFGSGKADVMIGTQMLAKGLHFPEVTLVGILNSDLSLNIPDFRASEQTFQLITQVAGRAGRGLLAGTVLIQTCLPENEVILKAAKQDYEGFFKEELATRKFFHYPPFNQLVKIRLSGKNLKELETLAEKFRILLSRYLPLNYHITEANPAGHAKIKEHYRLQFLIKGEKMAPLLEALQHAKKQFTIPGGVKVFFDINPTSTYF